MAIIWCFRLTKIDCCMHINSIDYKGCDRAISMCMPAVSMLVIVRFHNGTSGARVPPQSTLLHQFIN